MGHIRLGDLPKSKRWRQVISLLEEGADPDTVASSTLAAAETGFKQAANDEGFKYTFWLLTEITIAAKEKNFSKELKNLGLDVPKEAGLFDILGAFTKNIDSYLQKQKARTDISEMAQLAAVEMLSQKCAALRKEVLKQTFFVSSDKSHEISKIHKQFYKLLKLVA